MPPFTPRSINLAGTAIGIDTEILSEMANETFLFARVPRESNLQQCIVRKTFLLRFYPKVLNDSARYS